MNAPDQHELRGKLSTMPMPDILQWLSGGLKTGALEIEGEAPVRIYFNEGQVIFASSMKPGFRLGEHLVRSGRITGIQLERALKENQMTGEKLTDVVVKRGWLTAEDVRQGITELAREILYDLFLWNDAEFVFRDGNLPVQVSASIVLDGQSLLFEGVRRQDEWRRIRERISDLDSVLELQEPPHTIAGSPLSEVQAEILGLVDGRATVKDVLRLSPFSSFDTMLEVFQFLSKGMLSQVAWQESTTWKNLRNRVPEADYVPVFSAARLQMDLEAEEWGICALIDGRKSLKEIIRESGQNPLIVHALVDRMRQQGYLAAGPSPRPAPIPISMAFQVFSQLHAQGSTEFPPAVWDRIRDLIPRPSGSMDPRELQQLDIGADEGRLMTMVDGSIKVSNVVHLSAMGRVQAAAALDKLMVVGLVELPGAETDAGQDISFEMLTPDPGWGGDQDGGLVAEEPDAQPLHDDFVPVRCSAVNEVVYLGPNEWRVLSFVDGARSVGKIAVDSGVTRNSVERALQRLIERQVLDPPAPIETPFGSPDGLPVMDTQSVDPRIVAQVMGLPEVRTDAPEEEQRLARAQRHLSRARQCYEQGQHRRAERIARLALALVPDVAELHRFLSRVLLELGQHTKAEKHVKQALQLEEDSAEAYYLLGCLQKSHGRIAVARQLFKKALAIDPTFADARAALGLDAES